MTIPRFSDWKKVNRELKRMVDKAEKDHVIFLNDKTKEVK